MIKVETTGNSNRWAKIERLSDSVVVDAAGQQRKSDAEPTRTAASGTPSDSNWLPAQKRAACKGQGAPANVVPVLAD